MRLVLGLGTAAMLVGPAHATYSIVATDTATREVGGAGTSCVGNLSVTVIYGSVPGKGAVHAQAYLGGPGKNAAVAQLGMDVAPATIISSITSPSFDGQAQTRQYGIVDLMGRSAGFTGSSTMAFTADRQGQIGTYTYSVQGNILTSAAVLDQAQGSFETTGCDLADRLMLALEAGALNGEGDSRCTDNFGIPSDSAFIQVDREGEPSGTYLRLDITDSRPNSPLLGLRVQYNAWRAGHPCPGTAKPDAGASTGGDAGNPAQPDGGGCCSTSDGGAGSSLLAIGVAVLLRRRRRCS